MNLSDIRRLLLVNSFLSPSYNDKKIIELICYNEFEGHGIASETWEEHWKLILHPIRGMYKNSKGEYNICNDNVNMTFHGKTADEVIQEAYTFLKEAPYMLLEEKYVTSAKV